MATATLIQGSRNGQNLAPRLTLRADGATGRRVYEVDADNPTDALLASGLPQLGAPWDSTFSTVLATSLDPQYQSGGDSTVPGFNGLTYVFVEYATPQASTGAINPQDVGSGERFSSADFGLTQREIRTDVNGLALLEPVSADFGAMTIEVSDFRAAFPYSAFLAIMDGRTPVNDGPIILPNVFGSAGSSAQVGAKQARLLTAAVEPFKNDLIRIRWALSLAASHDILQQPIDEKGDPAGPAQTFSIYPERDFTTLGFAAPAP